MILLKMLIVFAVGITFLYFGVNKNQLLLYTGLIIVLYAVLIPFISLFKESAREMDSLNEVEFKVKHKKKLPLYKQSFVLWMIALACILCFACSYLDISSLLFTENIYFVFGIFVLVLIAVIFFIVINNSNFKPFELLRNHESSEMSFTNLEVKDNANSILDALNEIFKYDVLYNLGKSSSYDKKRSEIVKVEKNNNEFVFANLTIKDYYIPVSDEAFSYNTFEHHIGVITKCKTTNHIEMLKDMKYIDKENYKIVPTHYSNIRPFVVFSDNGNAEKIISAISPLCSDFFSKTRGYVVLLIKNNRIILGLSDAQLGERRRIFNKTKTRRLILEGIDEITNFLIELKNTIERIDIA